MTTLRGYKSGDYLVQDDLTGRTIYASQALKDYRGNVVSKKSYLEQNPQDFVKVIPESQPNDPVRPKNVVSPLVLYSDVIGDTNIRKAKGPATHLFDKGVGEMEIGVTFYVR